MTENKDNWLSVSKTLPFVFFVNLLYNFIHLELLLQVIFILLNFPPLLFLENSKMKKDCYISLNSAKGDGGQICTKYDTDIQLTNAVNCYHFNFFISFLPDREQARLVNNLT